MDDWKLKIGLDPSGGACAPRGAAYGLRLVGATEPADTPATLRAKELLAARRGIAAENRLASSNRGLDPRDPRWLVALQTAAHLEGPILSFERRRRVLAFAQRVGVRAFDANLIIAAVQDRARRGEPTLAAEPVVAIAAPAARRSRRWPIAIAAVIALAVHAAAILWLVR